MTPPITNSIPLRCDWALFLDLDGTLLEFAERPELVTVPAELPTLLVELGRALGNAIALLSGRTLESIDSLFPDLALAISGVHGLEQRGPDGAETRAPPHSGIAAIKQELSAFAADKPGLIVEDKKRAVAIHFRARPELEAGIRAHIADAISGHDGLMAMDGKMVIEVKPRNHDKGTAIRNFMATPPFSKRVPIFFGDDKTDEYGFSAVRALGGVGVKIGGLTETNASHRLENVSAVHVWLNELRTFLAQEQAG